MYTSMVDGLSSCKVLASFAKSDLEALARHMTCLKFPHNTTIVREGDTDEQMYFVLSGSARIQRAELELETVHHGDYFGELGLVARTPRAADVKVINELIAARLSAEGLRRLSEQTPSLALRLLRALVGGVASRLGEMTESVGVLLHERSLPRHTTIRVTTEEGERSIPTGTVIESLLPSHVDGKQVVAGLVNRRATSSVARLASDCHLAPLTVEHWEGWRIYQCSVSLLLLEAASRLSPPLTIRISSSLGFAQRIEVMCGEVGRSVIDLADALQKTMHHLVDDDRPLREEVWTIEEAQAHFAQVGWSNGLELLQTSRDATASIVSYGDVHSLQMGPLVARTGQLSGFRVIPDEGYRGLLLLYGKKPQEESQLTEGWRSRGTRHSVVVKAISKHSVELAGNYQRWLSTVGITSVGEFNKACISDSVSQLIRVAEGFQEKRLSQIADELQSHASQVKVVCIAGPSSSGKTTFIKRLSVQLKVNGIHPRSISLDDYYVDRESTPLDADGEYDYESFDALRTELLQDNLERLLAGETVRTARYDFKTGRSAPGAGPELTLYPNDMLILEGIHGLNPRLLDNISEQSIFRIYICPLAQLPFDRLNRVHSSDLRLLRRVVRDRHGRGTNAASTIMRWPSVRRGERRNIFPFQHNNDAVFDSSLIYELSVLKVYAERYLLEVPQDDPAYTTAFRLLQLLDRFVSIYPDHVPPTSILREFIQGSGFGY